MGLFGKSRIGLDDVTGFVWNSNTMPIERVDMLSLLVSRSKEVSMAYSTFNQFTAGCSVIPSDVDRMIVSLQTASTMASRLRKGIRCIMR